MRIARVEADSFMLVFESDWSLTGVPLGVKIIIYSAATQRSRSTLHRSPTTNSWTKADLCPLVMGDKNLDIRVIVQYATCNTPIFNKY